MIQFDTKPIKSTPRVDAGRVFDGPARPDFLLGPPGPARLRLGRPRPACGPSQFSPSPAGPAGLTQN
uniref:Uncharacterized protein n=1 Tax=Panagrellus redivivus TaxID=6233 RepID=A0A7E4VAE9_PANRE